MSKKSRPWTRRQRARIRERTERGTQRASWRSESFFGVDRGTFSNASLFNGCGPITPEVIEEAVKAMLAMPVPPPCGMTDEYPHIVPPNATGRRVQCGNCGGWVIPVSDGRAIDANPPWLDFMTPKPAPPGDYLFQAGDRDERAEPGKGDT